MLLNDDIEVLPGWLESLVETADRHPDAGAVGSLILFPAGAIQEAGSIAWRDGSTLSVGRGDLVEANPYNFLRAVDYCSACSLLVRREAWEARDGFDPRYFPAYYEDIDLCFGLARAGWRTLLQPSSRVIHHESASSTTPRKLFLMLRHRETFQRKWAREVADFEPAAPTDQGAVGARTAGIRKAMFFNTNRAFPLTPRAHYLPAGMSSERSAAVARIRMTLARENVDAIGEHVSLGLM